MQLSLSEEVELLRQNLSYYMYAGSEKAKKTGKNTIYVAGESRVGKSTIFSYVSGAKLKGKKARKHHVCYLSD